MTFIRGTQTEISFLAKNSFFLIMGMLFDPSSLGSNVFWLTALLIVLIIMSRTVSVGVISLLEKKYLKNVFAVSFMVPRGLTFSLAAFLTIRSAVDIPLLTEIVTIMVMLTTIITTIGYFLVEKMLKNKNSSMVNPGGS